MASTIHPSVASDKVIERRDIPAPLSKRCLMEAVGTAIIILFGNGAVNSAVLTNAQVGIWQVAIIWGIGILIAILISAPVSGGHLNPAVSLAFAMFRSTDFPVKDLFPYVASQILGAFFVSFINYAIFSKPLKAFHRKNEISSFSEDKAVLSAMAFGEYYPNPAFVSDESLGWDETTVSFQNCLVIEIIGTFILVLVIFSVTHEKNNVSHSLAAPAYISLTVTALIAIWAPLNQAGFNPARDFGPRCAATLIGYGQIGLPGPNFEAIPYIVGPLVGGPLGAAFFVYAVEPSY